MQSILGEARINVTGFAMIFMFCLHRTMKRYPETLTDSYRKHHVSDQQLIQARKGACG